ncbi:MAG: hypothetical protein HGA61_03845, partial [Candidatus Moranbacteria bacterium]|nr:hypothetical protein [Candidatus Moranbacteria bacterium]
ITNLDWVSGAAFLINADLFKEIGGFDENFFMYFEDVDLCLRLKRLGKKILLLSKSNVLHFGGRSSNNDLEKKRYYYESQDYYFKKHFGIFQAISIKFIRELFLKIKNGVLADSEEKLFFIFITLCFLIPFQFALNPAEKIDLAVIRVAVPTFFLTSLLYAIRRGVLEKLKDRTTLFILCFLALAVFSMLFSRNLQWSLRKIAFLFSIFPIYFSTLFLLTNEHRRRKTISVLVIGGLFLSLFALIQFGSQFLFGIEKIYIFLAESIIPFFLGNTFSKEVLAYPSWLVNSGGTTYMRAFAPFPDPHMLAYYVELLFPWSIALWATSKYHKTLFLTTSAFLITCVIATFTRGSYLALIISSLLILPLVSRKTALKIIAGIFFFILLFFAVPKNPVTNPVANRLVSSFDINEGSNQGRINIWKKALSVVLKNPQGVGIGSYPLIVDPGVSYRVPIYTHNAFLDIAVELGIIASVVFLLLIGTALKAFLQAAEKDTFYLAGVASLLIFSFHSLVENPLFSVHVLPLLLIILAISSSLRIKK